MAGTGEERATPAMILAMLRDLPKHSRLAARTEPLAEKVDPEPEVLAYLDRREWNDTGRMLDAAQVNLLGELLQFVPQWKDGKGPKPTPVGPMAWRQKSPAVESKKKPASIEDAMRVFGWQS